MSANSRQRGVRRFARRPGNGWKHIAGSAVWEHTTGLRIHLRGMARLPDGQSVPWRFDDEYDAKRQQGYNAKRALMVWSLSLLSPNVALTDPAAQPKETL
jgi:hypothetical protein